MPTSRTFRGLRPRGLLGLLASMGLALAVIGACDLAAEPTPPAGSPSVAPATPRPTPMLTEPAPTPEPSFLIYQVKPNDALEAIARRYRTTVDSIGYWNRQRYASLDPDSASYRPDSIKVGWLLRIHPGETTDGDDGSATDAPSPAGSPDGSPGNVPSEPASPAPSA